MVRDAGAGAGGGFGVARLSGGVMVDREDGPGMAGLSGGGAGTSRADSGSGSGSRSWIWEAVERFEGPLIRYARKILGGDSERARDVVQETFLKLCGQDREAVEPILGVWLYRVARNGAIDVLRKERRMSEFADGAEEGLSGSGSEASEGMERREAAARAAEWLERLPGPQREAIRLKFEGGFSYKEIASITGHSVSYVGVLIHTGMKTLRARFEAWEREGAGA